MDSIFLASLRELDPKIDENFKKIRVLERIIGEITIVKADSDDLSCTYLQDSQDSLHKIINLLKDDNGRRLHTIMRQKENMIKNFKETI